jgi:hypothetical protein
MKGTRVGRYRFQEQQLIMSAASEGEIRDEDRKMSKLPKEYRLISLSDGQSYGGFISLTGAREYAREENIENWGNLPREQVG